MRTELATELRACVLRSGDAGLVWDYAHHPEGHDDREVWQVCRATLPAGSPRDPLAEARLRQLDAEYGW